MIRVELLAHQRRRSPWSKALLLVLVVCGGLYGTHQFSPALVRPLFNEGSDLISKVQQEFAPKPTAQQETTPTPGQETTPKPGAQQEKATPSPAVQQKSTPEPTAQQETTPTPEQDPPSHTVQQKSTSEPTAQQETTPTPEQDPPSHTVQQESTPEPTTQQETTPTPGQDPPSHAVQQESTPEPTTQQETTPSSIVQREATPRPTTPTPTPPQDPSSQRSTACHQVMRINEKVPAGIRVSSLICNSSGEYWLEGTSPSHKVLRMFRLSLQALSSRVSFSAWQEERTLRFALQGHFAEQGTPPLAALSSAQAEQFFGKVARWADASGLDSLSIENPTHRPLSPTRTHQRQKLRGIGSPQQIDAFLQQLQQAEEVATLGEVLLMPITSDERGWVQARLYAAVDIIVDGP